MRGIKTLIIVFIVFIITGCRNEYNIYIHDNKVVEKFHMEIESNSKYKKFYDGDFYPLHGNFTNTYQKELKEDGNKDILDLKYVYSYADFANANYLHQCFNYANIDYKDDSFFSIKLKKPNVCMLQTNYTINIITYNKVVYNNADKVKGNKYIWYVNNNEKDKFDLEIRVEKGTEPTVVERNMYIVYIVIAIVVVAISVIAFITYRRRKVNNKI